MDNFEMDSKNENEQLVVINMSPRTINNEVMTIDEDIEDKYENIFENIEKYLIKKLSLDLVMNIYNNSG
jgi:S-adenosylmethionine hydrolase